jgi:transposase
VPRIVPDNLKTGVIKHPREGEDVLNDSYREMAAHYSAAVLPGRVRAPKDYSEDSVIPSRCHFPCLAVGVGSGFSG